MAKSTRSTTTTDKKPASMRRSSKTAPKVNDGAVDRDAIARRAYEIFQARGGEHGYEIEDWLQAERELTGRQETA
jgi:hypothetical protein